MRNFEAYAQAHGQEALELLIELAQIPAPSNHEEKRAEFCKAWLEQQGAQGVYIDEALNVVYPLGKEPVTAVFMAHSDVVFPDTAPLPLTVSDGCVRCPGVGDDTANAVALLMAAKYITEKNLSPCHGGVLLVINSGEEGLGNLKGVRKIMSDFGANVREFVTFDAFNCGGVHHAVGSRRFRIEARTQGGHSFNDFGRKNAIAVLADLIHALYQITIPVKGKTTYNVGTISGGTSVNTIAQYAEMLYEFRSNDRDSLAYMQEQFDGVLSRFAEYDLTVTLVGERPCGAPVDAEDHGALMERASAAALRHYGQKIRFGSGSTDCNIPLSMGIPSICVGCCFGGGAHTREEFVQIDSLVPGMKLALDLILHHFE